MVKISRNKRLSSKKNLKKNLKNKNLLKNEQKINLILKNTITINSSNSVIVNRFNINILRSDIATLESSRWLNDKIVDFYLHLIMYFHTDCLMLSTLIYTSICAHGLEMVSEWFNNTNFFSYRIVFIPMCYNSHWRLISIDTIMKSINYYDSLAGQEFPNYIVDFLQNNASKNQVDFTHYKTNIILNDPIQHNTSDCGVFLCQFVKCLANKTEMIFNQSLMPKIRSIMIYEIVECELVGLEVINQLKINEQNEYFESLNNIKIEKNSTQIEECVISDPSEHKTQKTTQNSIKTVKVNNNKNLKYAALNVDEDIPELYLGKMNKICPHCKALFFKNETIKCCLNGALCQMLYPKLLEYEKVPNLFKELYNQEHEYSEIFLKNIRLLNSIFSFTSLGISSHLKRNDAIISDSTLGGFVMIFHGDVYHNIGSLLPTKGTKNFGQILFYDSEFDELNRRKELIKKYKVKVPDKLINLIQVELHKHNEFYKIYKPIGREILEKDDQVMVIVDDFKKVNIRKEHKKCYNRPTANDISVLIPNNNLSYSRDIIIQKQSNLLKRIDVQQPAVDPLGYPLLFPNGNLGWSPNMQFTKPEPQNESNINFNELINDKSIKFYRITLTLYMMFMLNVRKDFFNLLFKGGKLFHQFIANKWADIEFIRLFFFENNSNKLRICSYKNVLKAAANFEKSREIGKVTVLPSNHINSPRHLYELFHDSMAMVAQLGKPDLFITMTCNVGWNEIQEQLFKGQTPKDRPDLICNVFKLKKDNLLNDIIKQEIFGKIIGYTWVIEFQKRGLPHCHMLFWLDEKDKPKKPQEIDKIIYAEIPNQTRFPKLFKNVMKHMIHIPCNSKFAKCNKGKGEKCDKKFPKEYQSYTSMDSNSFPKYKRREGNNVNYYYYKTIIKVNNSNVVPYNPYLLLKYNCHINVEMCSTIKAIKYLNKYIFKGNDRAIVERSTNEVKQYLNTRYISSVEAYWRLKGYKLYDHYPNVIRLPIHLENEEHLVFNENDEIEKILKTKKPKTKFTEWFTSNKKHPEFKHLTYFEYPKFFSWNNSKKEWVKRTRNISINSSNNNSNKMNKDIVCRVYQIDPKNNEQFYLKNILRYKPGAICYADLKEVNGITYKNFRDVAKALNILKKEDDKLWIDTLEEAIFYECNSFKLRRLFAHILMECQVSNPVNLWNKFSKYLGDDHKKKLGFETKNYDDLSIIQKRLLDNFILKDIQKLLIGNKKELKLSNFGLPDPIETLSIDYANKHPIDQKLLNLYDETKLTTNQKLIFDSIFKMLNERKNSVNNLSSNIIFINSPGGCGKTHLLNSIIISALQRGYIVSAVGSTGISSILLHNGLTAHSLFKLPIPPNENPHSVCNIERNSPLADYLKKIELIVWDEATMINRFQLEALDRTFKDFTNVETIFGNKIVVFAGDFRQTLPVIKHSNKSKILNHCIKNSYILDNCKEFFLTENLRMTGSKEQKYFSEYILKIGNDLIQKNIDEEISIKKELLFDNDNIDDFIEYLYPKHQLFEGNELVYQSTGILAPLNEDIHYLNNLVLNKFVSNNQQQIYEATDELDKSCLNMYITEQLLNSIEQSNLPQFKIILKTGSLIFLLRNINVKQGLVNGTKILITKLAKNLIFGKIISGRFKNQDIEIPRIWISSDREEPIKFTRLQFPVKLAFAISIHKAQGQGLEKVGLYLKNQSFTHGQTYVGLSRATNFKNIKIFPGSQNKIKNIVYKEVL